MLNVQLAAPHEQYWLCYQLKKGQKDPQSLLLLVDPKKVNLQNTLQNSHCSTFYFPQQKDYKLIVKHLTIKTMLFRQRSYSKNEKAIPEGFFEIAKNNYCQKKVQFLKQLINNNNYLQSPSGILKLYTYDSVFYRVINNLLRIGSHSFEIYYADCLAKQLHQCINNIAEEQKKIDAYNAFLFQTKGKKQTQKFKCYRGSRNQGYQVVDKFIRHKGGYVKTFTFFSTSLQKFIAQKFAKKILYEIQVEKNIVNENRDYVFIEMYSQFRQQKEVLFNALTIFKIIDASEKEMLSGDKIWVIKLLYSPRNQAERKKNKKFQSFIERDFWTDHLFCKNQLQVLAFQRFSAIDSLIAQINDLGFQIQHKITYGLDINRIKTFPCRQFYKLYKKLQRQETAQNFYFLQIFFSLRYIKGALSFLRKYQLL